MNITELKKLVKECVKEVVQEDDFISKIIIESYKAIKAIDQINESVKQKPAQTQKLQKQEQNKPTEKELWQKIINAKRPTEVNEDMSFLAKDFANISNPQKTQEQKPINSLSDLLQQPSVIEEDQSFEVKEDKEFMDFFAKKYKR